METRNNDTNPECNLNSIFKMAVIFWAGVAVIIGAFIGIFGLN